MKNFTESGAHPDTLEQVKYAITDLLSEGPDIGASGSACSWIEPGSLVVPSSNMVRSASDATDTASFVLRSSTSGAPVEREVQQSEWNIDPFDGTGPSGITLDFTCTQILLIDAQNLLVIGYAEFRPV